MKTIMASLRRYKSGRSVMATVMTTALRHALFYRFVVNLHQARVCARSLCRRLQDVGFHLQVLAEVRTVQHVELEGDVLATEPREAPCGQELFATPDPTHELTELRPVLLFLEGGAALHVSPQGTDGGPTLPASNGVTELFDNIRRPRLVQGEVAGVEIRQHVLEALDELREAVALVLLRAVGEVQHHEDEEHQGVLACSAICALEVPTRAMAEVVELLDIDLEAALEREHAGEPVAALVDGPAQHRPLPPIVGCPPLCALLHLEEPQVVGGALADLVVQPAQEADRARAVLLLGAPRLGPGKGCAALQPCALSEARGSPLQQAELRREAVAEIEGLRHLTMGAMSHRP